MGEELIRSKRVPFWKIWANPIVRRYARSRLRPVGLGVWALLILLVAGFLFFLLRALAVHQGDMDIVDAARIPLIPLGILQMIVLFFLGTGQVAGAMTAEADEGVLEYQRLAPMTPLAKVFGYLFALPIREWVLFWITMPFTVVSLWQGEVPLRIGVQLYAVFLAAGILYHLTGLLAGTVMKNRRWAFLSSMGLIFILYTVLPQASKFGMVYFKYLTIMPVVEESLPFLIERDTGALVDSVQNILGTARFFGLDFPQAIFTLLSMGVLILVMVTMLWRRWRRKESHLLGKLGAAGLFGWIQLVLLGNAIPLIDTGRVFPSLEFSRRFGQVLSRRHSGWAPEAWEAMVMVGAFGFVSIVMLWWMALLITPDHEGQVRGWRRARKVGRSRLAWNSDPATGAPWVLLMAGMGTWGWYSFAEAIIGSRWFPGYDMAPNAIWAFALVMLTGGLGFQALMEGKGKKAAGMAVILVGILPVMVGTVLAVTNERFAALAVWLIGLCPAGWPVYASGVAMPTEDMPREIERAMPNAFWFWQGVAVLVSLYLLWKLRESRKVIAERTLDLE